jgi:broad specificity phosphatase PhoE
MRTTSALAEGNNNEHTNSPGERKLPPLPPLAETIVLVRHGKSAGNVLSHRPRKDFYLPHGMTDETLPLTDRGKIQASKTGEWLAKTYPEGFDVIISSPFLRAKKTAEFACRAAGWNVGNIILEPLAGERDWGVFLDVHARAHDFLRKIHSEYEGKRILVFTHGEFIQECIAAALEELYQPTDLAPRKKPKNCQVFELSLHSTPLHFTEEDNSNAASPESGKRWQLQTSCPSED